ncbi:MAG: glutamate-cysteine ligase family protein [Desulfuromonadales bacterium]|nr:glutamate-cysteine ligase family protein [Desulfuromonadales bacterium]
MTTIIKSDLAQPITATDQLCAYLAAGARPADQLMIGAEVEKLVVDAQTGEAASYDRIEALLKRLALDSHWHEVHEQGHLIALTGNGASITLEPGGQLELSGRICPDVHCSRGEVICHACRLVELGREMGLVFLGLGVQPFSTLEKISWVPKARYSIMGPYMTRTGNMGQRMMKQTSGLQVNLDFTDEADCFAKLRLSLALAPVLYALFANSPLLDGKPSGFLSTRGEIWSRTDPDRTGLLLPLWNEEAGFSAYVELVLDVPMYFIYRAGRYLDLTRERFTFRRYLQEGFGGQRATLGDWDMHLSTLFSEARLRPQIEIRSPDSLPLEYCMAPCAFLKGLLYEAEACDAAGRILAVVARDDYPAVTRQAWRDGLRTPFGSRTLREVSLDLLDLARDGLRRQHAASRCGKAHQHDEWHYLEAFYQLAQSGATLAERLLSRWGGDRAHQLAVLVDHCGYCRDMPECQ